MASDTAPLNRPASDSLGARMTVVERDLYHLGVRLDEHLLASKEGHEATVRLLEKLDARDDAIETRQDKVDLRLAYIAGAAGVGMALIQLFGPALRQALGLP